MVLDRTPIGDERGSVGNVASPDLVGLDTVTGDIAEPGAGQHRANPRRVGESRRPRAVLTGRGRQKRCQRAENGAEVGSGECGHAQEGEPAARFQRPADIRERGDRIGEERHREPAERDVENRVLEREDLDVALLEHHIRDTFGVRARPRRREHRGGQVDPGRSPERSTDGGEPGDLPVAAAEVEHPVPLADSGGVEQEFVESAVHRVVALVVLGPMPSLVAVPRLRLRGVDDAGHTRTSSVMNVRS